MRVTLVVANTPRPKLHSSESGGGKGKHQIRSGSKTYILKGQDVPYCDFCGRKGHPQTSCRIKAKDMASAKKETNDKSAHSKKENAEKAQSFAGTASASK
jgi:hypothetical protein